MLQAGSFKSQDQADKLKGRLAMYGVEANIQRFALEDETWYRVRIGPIATVEELEAVRAKLAEAEIEATPMSSRSSRCRHRNAQKNGSKRGRPVPRMPPSLINFLS